MVERVMPLIGVGDEGNGTALFQADKQLGVNNHMLFRQCRNYRVSFRLGRSANTDESSYYFFTLRDNWYTNGAIKAAYNEYLDGVLDELKGGQAFAKWADFRINPEAISAAELRAAIYNGSSYTSVAPDEYGLSELEGTDGNLKNFCIMDSVTNGMNIFSEYQDIINNRRADALTVTHEVAYQDVNSGSDHETEEVMAETGDVPPYDWNLSADQDHPWVLKGSLHYDPDGGVADSRTGMFDAPLGMVLCLKTVNQTLTDFATNLPELICVVGKGDYKGVHAPAIVDFNPRALEDKYLGKVG